MYIYVDIYYHQMMMQLVDPSKESISPYISKVSLSLSLSLSIPLPEP